MAGHTRPSISEAALVEEDEDEEEEGTPGRGSDAAGAPGFSGGVCGKCGVVVSSRVAVRARHRCESERGFRKPTHHPNAVVAALPSIRGSPPSILGSLLASGELLHKLANGRLELSAEMVGTEALTWYHRIAGHQLSFDQVTWSPYT